MKTILRNFFSVLRRFKAASVLNVLGLSIAFVAFMLIMMQVNYDYTFDCSHRNADAIFRVDIVHGSKGSQAIICRPFARAFTESSPHIKGGCLLNAWVGSPFFYVEQNGQRTGYRENAWEVTPGLLDVIHFDMLEGTAQALDEPGSVILPESMAKKIFGNETAVGKQLIAPNVEMNAQIIKGVYKDFPRNSALQNVIYVVMNPKENYDNWGNWNYFFFVRLDDPANKENVLDNFKSNFNAKEVFGNEFEWGGEESFDLRLTSLPDVHFLNNVDFDSMPKASRQTLLVLFSIAFVIIIIAGINFTNFSTALTPMRIKSINTQKVLGSSDRMLRGSLLVEAVGVSTFAYLLSLLFLYVIPKTPVASLVDADISFGAQPMIIAGTAVIAVIVGVLAGLYPSYYVTSFPPALVLKGSFGLSLAGRRMRSVLVGIQFVASFILIIGSLFMYLQNRYMQNAPLGYDKEEMIIVHLNNKINKDRDAFTNQLKSFSGVEDVTYSQFLLSSQDQYMGWGRDYNGKNINFQCLPVSSSFLKVMGIEVKEGRDFRPEDDQKETGCYIFNEKAKAQLELKLNEQIDGDEIIGFIPDIKFASFRQEVTPMAFYLWGKYQWGQEGNYYNAAYVKFKAGSDLRAGMEHVRESLKKFDSEYPFVIRFYDEVLQHTYEKELKIGSLITLFSLVAIFISIVGVFGLVVFESEYKRKEIAVRKVLGSTTGEVLYMFNVSYFWILLICFVLGAPVAWYGVHRWLENFAYRTPMYWWVLPLAFLAIGMITFLTVTYQNWHVANENPVKNIKSE
ncbi:ABC transporter permease [Parabacteroides johnsonii]|jgi:putative ABC transport system permease protein|uniref:ABC transporter permease n=1 Tax=Parabacteroides johnsonii TaxID=387661 RepID=UPI0018976910|nr:ABC transporter permease [Parabacteroides johnsonii]MBS6225662.1 FtsX-like permease family protein [Parabacteroides johnsonii]